MASLSLSLFLAIILEITLISISYGQRPPSPGYYPTALFPSAVFYRYFTNLWGPQHQSVSPDQSSVTIWLDRATGSGFKSRKPFRSGYFGASIKLQTGYTAGVITAFYLSNNEAHPGMHDEVDIEFLGTTPGKPYTLQTNVYINGSGDRKIIGREMKFHLWFDPTADFHHYAILWNPREIMSLRVCETVLLWITNLAFCHYHSKNCSSVFFSSREQKRSNLIPMVTCYP